MESINLDLKTSKKKRLILNGDENKVLVFNPHDMRTRKKFYDASQKIFKSEEEFDARLKALKDDELDKAFELENDLFEMMKELVDSTFGEGVTEMITDGDVDIEAICNFLFAITPYFKEVTDQQKNKYTNGLKNAGII